MVRLWGVCTEEFEPYRAFISSGKEQPYQYLETMCDYFEARASYMNPDGEIISERELARRVRVRLQPVGVREAVEIRVGMRAFIVPGG